MPSFFLLISDYPLSYSPEPCRRVSITVKLCVNTLYIPVPNIMSPIMLSFLETRLSISPVPLCFPVVFHHAILSIHCPLLFPVPIST